MGENKSFELSLDYEGQHYSGLITPSDEIGDSGMPIFFRVSFGDQLFAYLCCGDNGWGEKDVAGQPSGLISAIGNYIADFYE
ncbi:MAG TPA: hypothetical protein VGN00_22680 [Puia sp.]|jgi:hypothetical protein